MNKIYSWIVPSFGFNIDISPNQLQNEGEIGLFNKINSIQFVLMLIYILVVILPFEFFFIFDDSIIFSFFPSIIFFEQKKSFLDPNTSTPIFTYEAYRPLLGIKFEKI